MATIEELKSEIDALKKEIKILRDEDTGLDPEQKREKDQQSVDLAIQRLKIEQKQMAAMGEVNNALQKQFEIRDKLKQKEQAAAMSGAELDRLADLRKKTSRTEQEKQELARLEAIIKEQDAIKDLIKNIDEQVDGIDRLSKKQKEAKGEFDEFFTGIGTHLGILSPAMNGYLKTATKIGELAKENPAQVAKSMRDSFSPTKIILGLTEQILSATLKYALAVDKATAAFAAQTGAGRALTQEIASVGGEFRNLGIGAEDAGKAAGSLFDNFTGFMQTSKEGRKELMQTVAALDKIGVSGDTAAKSLQIMSLNFSMSTGEATKMTKQLAIAGTKIGISASKMMDGFVQASKSLAVYGKESIEVFKDLAAQAKAAGVETQTLLGIAEQFDTFAGSAEAAGKLNSILGTQISAIDMLNMKENERIETLIRSMQAQGRSFKDMDRFSQKAIANAAGITDMAEAQRIFSMSVNDYRKGLKNAAEEEEFNKRLKDSMDIYKKLEKAFQNFAIQLGPFVDKIAGAVQVFLDFSQALGGWPVYLIGGAIALKGFALILSPLIGLFSTTAAAAPAAGAGLSGLGKGAAAAAPGMAALAMPLLGVAAAIGIFGLAILAMSKAGGGGAEGVLTAMLGLAVGLMAIGGAAAVLGAMSIFIGLGAAALIAFSVGVLMLSLALATIKLEKLSALATIMDSLTSAKGKVSLMVDVGDFTKQLVDHEATLRPILGDLALITTGRTSDGITASTTNTAFQQFSANFKNIFKPEITVKIGEKELRGIIQEEVSKNSMSGDN